VVNSSGQDLHANDNNRFFSAVGMHELMQSDSKNTAPFDGQLRKKRDTNFKTVNTRDLLFGGAAATWRERDEMQAENCRPITTRCFL
jgi:hypothetical protein